jgi:hypothetical protein
MLFGAARCGYEGAIAGSQAGCRSEPAFIRLLENVS